MANPPAHLMPSIWIMLTVQEAMLASQDAHDEWEEYYGWGMPKTWSLKSKAISLIQHDMVLNSERARWRSRFPDKPMYHLTSGSFNIFGAHQMPSLVTCSAPHC